MESSGPKEDFQTAKMKMIKRSDYLFQLLKLTYTVRNQG